MNDSKNYQKPKDLIRRGRNSNSLKVAVFLSIVISFLFVVVSYFMYLKNPNYKYDLSRPDVDKTVGIDNKDSVKEDTSPIDANIVEDVQDSISSQLNDLKSVGDFNKEPLSDKALLLKGN